MIFLLAPGEDQIYKLLGQSNQWENELEGVQKLLTKLSKYNQINEGHLYKLFQAKWLPYICPSSRVDTVMEGHKQIGHGAASKNYEWLKSRYYWKGMLYTIHQVLEAFLTCRSHTGPNPCFQHKIPSPTSPFHVVSIDLFGPLPMALGGHKFIFLAIDHLNKLVEAASMASASAKATVSFLLKYIFSRFGRPKVLLSDNGLDFASQIVTELTSLFETYQIFAAPYHPSTNGTLERANGTLFSILRKMASSFNGE